MTTSQDKRKHYYFTWGTLKQGFPNHDANKEVLGDLIGKFTTVKPLSLIVPLASFCPNKGCRFVHRIGALTEKTLSQSAKLKGEVYLISEAGLAQLDNLENYDPKSTTNSYVRKTIDLASDATGEVINAYIYFINDAEKYEALLQVEQAEIVPEYTLDMARGKYKPCCEANNNHQGPHDELPFPTLPAKNYAI